MTPPVNITILRDVLEPFLATNPELQAQFQPIFQAAELSGENNELTVSEARLYLQRSIREASSARSLLTRHREDLVGRLRETRRILEDDGASEELLSLVEMAATQDEEHDEISEAESELLFQHIEQTLLQLEGPPAGTELMPGEEIEVLTPEALLDNASNLVREAREVRREIPEAFRPEDPAERTATIDLNFLKSVPPTTIFAETDQGAILQQLLLSGNILNLEALETNPDALREDNPDFDALVDRDQEWDITYQDLEAAYARLPDHERSEMPPIEEMMCNLRFFAMMTRDEFETRRAEAVRAGEDGAEGVDLGPLAARAEEFRDNPFVEQLFHVAGADGVLTPEDVAAHIRELRRNNPNLEIDPELYLASARAMVEDLAAASPEEAAAIGADHELSRDAYLSQMVIEDLRRMRDGYTAADTDYVENDFLFATANAGVHFFTLVGTLGIYHLAGGPSWRDLRREEAEAGNTLRNNAIQFLERMLAHPPRDYRDWLESRPEGELGANIGTALEYMRGYGDRYQARVNAIMDHEISAEDLRRYLADWESGDAARIAGIPEEHREYIDFRSHYEAEPIAASEVQDFLSMYNVELPRIVAENVELLTGSLLRADRLWEIRNLADTQEAEQAWFDFAEELRDGCWTSGTTVLTHTNNPVFARAILHALRRNSADEDMRSGARVAYQDSVGADITDDEGHVVTEGGGEFNLWPPDWFRNFSDENVSYAINDIILMVATWRAGGMLFRGATRVMSTGGRVLGRGVLSMLGVGLALGEAGAGATAVAGEEAAVMAPGMVSRWLARMVARRVSQAESRVIALEAARAAGQTVTREEMTAASEALANATRVHEILSAPMASGVRGQITAAVADRLLNPEAFTGRLLTRITAYSARVGTALASASERPVLGPVINGVGVTLWLTARGVRLTGRFLRWLSYDGIVTMGIAGYLYDAAPRHLNQPLVFDREYELDLPDDPGPRVSDEDHDDASEPDSDESARREASRLARGIVEAGE